MWSRHRGFGVVSGVLVVLSLVVLCVCLRSLVCTHICMCSVVLMYVCLCSQFKSHLWRVREPVSRLLRDRLALVARCRNHSLTRSPLRHRLLLVVVVRLVSWFLARHNTRTCTACGTPRVSTTSSARCLAARTRSGWLSTSIACRVMFISLLYVSSACDCVVIVLCVLVLSARSATVLSSATGSTRTSNSSSRRTS